MKKRKTQLQKIELTTKQKRQVKKDRQEIADILSGKDNRLLIIVGPCSAWPENAVLEYGKRLAEFQDELKRELKLVMRVYTQKPRTNIGWKGMLFEPNPCSESSLKKGIKVVQNMQKKLLDMGLAIADEALFLAPTLYFEDALSYVAIGARSTEDQEHRLFASTRNYPVGVKNPTSGDLEIAINSVLAGQYAGNFYADGYEYISDGNESTHLILRGGKKPNYKERDILQALSFLEENKIQPAIIIDTNHANSKKDYKKQIQIAKYVMKVCDKNSKIKRAFKGFMIESFIKEGSQSITCGQIDEGGLSITDPCLGWSDTEELLRWVADRV